MKRVTFEIPDDFGLITFDVIGVWDRNVCNVVHGGVKPDEGNLVRVCKMDDGGYWYKVEREPDE